jgi:DNA-binding response OmpR family regulator
MKSLEITVRIPLYDLAPTASEIEMLSFVSIVEHQGEPPPLTEPQRELCRQVTHAKKSLDLLAKKKHLLALVAEIDQELAARVLRNTNSKFKRRHFVADETTGTIHFPTGEVKLTTTGFDIVSALLTAKNLRLITTDFFQKVWGNPLFPEESADRAIRRVNQSLKNAPFKIRPIKSAKTGEIMGYGIRK